MIFPVKRICAGKSALKALFCTDTVDRSIVVIPYKGRNDIYHDLWRGLVDSIGYKSKVLITCPRLVRGFTNVKERRSEFTDKDVVERRGRRRPAYMDKSIKPG